MHKANVFPAPKTTTKSSLCILLPFFVVVVFRDSVSPCIPEWPQTHHSPASASEYRITGGYKYVPP
jgi:hypothetical protein